MSRNYQIPKIAKKYLKRTEEKKTQPKDNIGEKKEIKDNIGEKEEVKNLQVKENPLTKRPKKENKKPEVNHKQLHRKLGWFIPLEKINKILRRNPLCIIP